MFRFTEQSPFPREHGAWAMLLQPFLGALIVYHRLTWTVAPALAAVVLVFLIREPWIILARQRWVWRAPRDETRQAKKILAWELPSLALVAIALGFVWPLWVLAILGGSATALTGLAVSMTIKNRQRAVWFQALSAAGLGSSALAVCFAIDGSVPWWGWWFWALHAAHFLTAILVVHARLDARISAKRQAPFQVPRQALWVQYVWLAAAAALVLLRMPIYAAAIAFSAIAHLVSLRTLRRPEAVAMPMKTVGLRAMTLSIVFTLVLVAGSIWPM